VQTSPATDLATAVITIPRGTGRDDPDPAPAVEESLWLLHVRYARAREPEVLGALVEEYQAYAVSLARRLHRQGEPLEDLRQVALESLVVALQRFDPGRGIPFVAYATPTVVGAIKRHYRDHGWALRVPRAAHDLAPAARDAVDRLTAGLGRAPTVAEVAADIGVSEEELLLARSATRARSLISLDAPQRTEDGDRVMEIGEDDASFALAEGRVALEAALRRLGVRDRTVLGLYFFEGLTQSQIAARFGVSQMQVSRWIASSLARLRSHMAGDGSAAEVEACG
jgi:RNA polymerase sigma-B factor